MSSDKVFALRQKRLGTELRKLRERTGMTTTVAARTLGVQPAQISNIESARHPVSAERVRAMAVNYSCADPGYVDALAGMTGARKRGWWEEYRESLHAGLIELAELEDSATTLRVAVIIHVPGLLQTVEHARAVFRENLPALPPHDVEHRISYRVKRQKVLYGASPTPYRAIVHEAALRMGVGGPETARAQLNYLLEMSERENISIVVIPFGEASFPVSGQSVVYATGPVPQLDTVELDTDYGCDFLDAEAQLAKYRAVLDRMESRALPPGKSRDLIHRIARDI
ncbi:helix-turn-helix transcriptional regulator [Streptomyces sp. NPDC048442]|uniref:helix-turn-helix domain-containing protein n=1 Tax=Streptomyces sp. NPDC048442 TaxID=3154823 RepID=UPI003423F4DD